MGNIMCAIVNDYDGDGTNDDDDNNNNNEDDKS